MSEITNPTCDPVTWGSYLPSVLACFASTVGPVLELGIGHISTPALHALCLSSDRMLVSVEQDEAWFKMFRSRYERPGHQFIKGEYDDVVPELAKQTWSVALIDNSPGGERTKKDFISLIKCSGFVVVHDYERENVESIEPLLGNLSRYVCNYYKPPTLVASLTRMIPATLIEI